MHSLTNDIPCRAATYGCGTTLAHALHRVRTPEKCFDSLRTPNDNPALMAVPTGRLQVYIANLYWTWAVWVTWGRCRRMLAGCPGILLLALGLPSMPGRGRRGLLLALGLPSMPGRGRRGLLLALGLPSVPGGRGHRRMGSGLAPLPSKRRCWRRSCGRLGLASCAAARLLSTKRYIRGGRLGLACCAAAQLLPESWGRCRGCGRLSLDRCADAGILDKCHRRCSRRRRLGLAC